LDTPDSHNRLQSLLIVDDEEIIRNLCAQALSGYRILQAGHGQDCADATGKFAL